jgi:uncharacterized protein YpuA (DUF1002 family)
MIKKRLKYPATLEDAKTIAETDVLGEVELPDDFALVPDTEMIATHKALEKNGLEPRRNKLMAAMIAGVLEKRRKEKQDRTIDPKG